MKVQLLPSFPPRGDDDGAAEVDAFGSTCVILATLLSSFTLCPDCNDGFQLRCG